MYDSLWMTMMQAKRHALWDSMSVPLLHKTTANRME